MFSFYNIEKRTFLISFLWKTPIRKSSIFGQNPRTNPFWKMSTFWPLLKLQFFGIKMIVFYLKYPKTIFSDIISVKNRDKRKFDFWTKFMNEKCLWKMSIFRPFLKLEFFPIKIILFFSQYQKRCFLIEFLWKTPIRKGLIFGQNPWTNTL